MLEVLPSCGVEYVACGRGRSKECEVSSLHYSQIAPVLWLICFEEVYREDVLRNNACIATTSSLSLV